MVASGKSSNRFGEWRRGYNGTLSVGPYAQAGIADRERDERRKREAEAKEHADDKDEKTTSGWDRW